MWRDDAYLLDILVAAQEARNHIATLSLEDFEHSRLHQQAVVKELEIIGEAANRISRKFKKQHPKVPWRELIGMRNRLVHEYFRIDLEEVWDTVKNDMRRLIKQIEPLVPPDIQ